MRTAIRPSGARRPGFTLIELLVVVVIIAILASIAIPRYSISKAKAVKAAAISDLRNLAVTQEQHHGNAGAYSADLGVLGVAPSSGVTVVIAEATGSGWSATATMDTGMCSIYIGTAAAVGAATSPGLVGCN